MPCRDISRHSQVLPDDAGPNSSDEDTESAYESCESFADGSTEEDGSHVQVGCTTSHEEFEILRLGQEEPLRPSDVPELFVDGTPTRDKGWIPGNEWFMYKLPYREMILDVVAVLADTLGGVSEDYRRSMVFSGEETLLLFQDLQILLVLVASGAKAWTGMDMLEQRFLYIPSQEMYNYSLTSSVFEQRIVLDCSQDRGRKDFEEVMSITLPFFLRMKARFEALSRFHNEGYSSSSESVFGPANMGNIVLCLDIAESVALPVLGDVLEGACGVLRKIVQASEVARAARDECKALAEHTACITLAILNEIGSASNNRRAIPTANIFDLCATIGEVERRVTKLSKLGRVKYFATRGKIAAEVKELRTRVDNARIVFKIRNDISTTGLLYDLRAMQVQLASRVEDIVEGQRVTHSKLDMILVKVGNNRGHQSHTAEE